MKEKRSGNVTFLEALLGNIKLRQNEFFNKVNEVIDWEALEREIDKIYKKEQSVNDSHAYSGILLFKMLLIETWYNMNDIECEEFVKDSISAMLFLGIDFNQTVPDHITLSRFRSELVAKRAYNRLLRKVNKQLESKKIRIRRRKAIIDPIISEISSCPEDKSFNEVIEDRLEEENYDYNAEIKRNNSITIDNDGTENGFRN